MEKTIQSIDEFMASGEADEIIGLLEERYLKKIEQKRTIPAGFYKVLTQDLEDLLNAELQEAENEDTFGKYLKRVIKSKRLKYKEVYDPAMITRQHFCRIVKGRDKERVCTPSKNTVYRIGLVLKLSLEEIHELLKTAGYTFKVGDRRDKLIIFCIKNKIYDFIEVEKYLEKHKVNSLFRDY